jgi:hypothetical protein
MSEESMHDELLRLRLEVPRLQQELAQALILKEAVMQVVQDTNRETAKFFKTLLDEVRPTVGFTRRTIWYMWKPGDPRAFAMTTQPSLEWAEGCKKEGYRLINFDIDVPDAADLRRGTLAQVQPDGEVQLQSDEEASGTLG